MNHTTAPIWATLPSQFVPLTLTDLIGPARQVGAIALAKAARIKPLPANLKYIFHGPPGTGKSSLATLIATLLAGHAIDIEDVSAVTLSVDLVRSWMANACYGSLFVDGWRVKIIQEIDRLSAAAQDLMLQYLDKLPPQWAVIATSNLDLENLSERLQTRFQDFPVPGTPDTDEIATFLLSHWPALGTSEANMIAVGCGGNMRAALLDAEKTLDCHLIAA